MNTPQSSLTSGSAIFSRLILSLVLALVLGSMLVSPVDAVPTKNSIADRVNAQRNTCTLLEGGSFESKTTAFGSVITTCTGGNGGNWKCVNTKKSTTCTPLTQPPSSPQGDVTTQPGGGAYQTPTEAGGGGTWTTGGSASGGVFFATAEERGQKANKHKDHGKGKKTHGEDKRKPHAGRRG
jgi:hypothetical protein